MKIVEQSCANCESVLPSTLLLRGLCAECRAKVDLAETKKNLPGLVADGKLIPGNNEPVTRKALGKKLKDHEARLEQNFEPSVEAQTELAKRELARRRLLPFVEKFTPDYQPGWVHVDICKRLEEFTEAVARRESPRLMLVMPPRHGKSQITSKRYPAWVLGHYPNWEFMSCSYSGALSMSFSREVRSIMRDPAYQQLFKTRLDPDSQSVEQWMTTNGGGLVAAGVGGAITGKGAHILVIDDPVKNREDADSETARRNTWDWYTSTAYTRLAPGGGVLVIQTRWHDDDLSGRLVQAMEDGGDEFEIVNYSAIAEEDEDYRKQGEALHPQRYDTVALNRIRRAIGERDWHALYQGNPISDEGAYFQKSWFKMYELHELPEADELVYYTAWDLAIGTKEANDYTVGVTVALDRNDKLWVVDMQRGKWDGMQIVEKIIDTWEQFRSQITGIERGQIELSLGPFLQKRIAERNAWGLYVEPMKTGRRDKQARARSIQGMLQAGHVFIPSTSECSWSLTMQNEMLRFPAGVHDDIVDAFAWVGLLIQDMAPSQPRKPKKPPSWKDKLDKFIKPTKDGGSWMTA